MKQIIIGALLLSSAASFSDDGPFQKHKARMLKNIEERSLRLVEHKTCVSSATTDEALKACSASLKAWHKQKEKEMREERKKEKALEKEKTKTDKPKKN